MYIYLFNVLKNKADVHPLYLVAAVTYPFTPASAIDTHRFYSLWYLTNLLVNGNPLGVKAVIYLNFSFAAECYDYK